MKLTVNKPILKSALDKCNPIAPTRVTIPAMACALVEANNNKLSVTVTNQDQRVTAIIEADIETEGIALIPFKRLLDMVDRMTGEISISLNDKNVMSFSCGNGSTKLHGIDPVLAVPNPDEPKNAVKFRDKEGVIPSVINRVKSACSSDQARHVLNGVLFTEEEGSLCLVATDGRRLMGCAIGIEAKVNAIVPTLAASAIATLFTEVDSEFSVSENLMTITSESTVFQTKLIEGNFPNWKQIIPGKADALKFKREEVLLALKFTSSISDTDGRISIESTKKGATISSVVNGEGEAAYEIAGKQKLETKVVLNSQFLKDAVSSLHGDEFEMESEKPTHPLKITEGDFVAVIMPMRVQG